MYSSIFSYNVSRSYPFRWFTPVVVVGGILIASAISVLNISTSGYQLVSVSSSDANTTEAETTLFSRSLGTLIGRGLRPVCASTTIPLGTVMYTNNTAFRYTLTDVSIINEDGSLKHQGSLVYHNNPLKNCTLSGTQIEFEGLQRPALNIARQMQGASTLTRVGCNVETLQGTMAINLTVAYNYLPDDQAFYNTQYTFLGRNTSTHASLYWGGSLLLMYWLSLTNAFYIENLDSGSEFYKGSILLSRNKSLPSEAADVESLDFFTKLECYFIPFSNTSIEKNLKFNQSSSLSDLSHASQLPGIWTSVDALSKTLYYTILTDLGQVDAPYINMLTDVGLLTYFTSNFTAINASVSRDKHPWGENLGTDPALASAPFTVASAALFDLRVNPSVLTADYLCQVPQLKPTSSLVISVLIADLVLLQTIWHVFKLVIDQLLGRRHPEMRFCEGCERNELPSLEIAGGALKNGAYNAVSN
jgi:hypothetical protein